MTLSEQATYKDLRELRAVLDSWSLTERVKQSLLRRLDTYTAAFDAVYRERRQLNDQIETFRQHLDMIRMKPDVQALHASNLLLRERIAELTRQQRKPRKQRKPFTRQVRQARENP